MQTKPVWKLKMTTAHQVAVCLSCFLILSVCAQFEGDSCTEKNTGKTGKCVALDNCNHAKNLLKSHQRPQHCGFNGTMPVVCCPLTTKPVPGGKSQKQCDVYYPKPEYPTSFIITGGKKSLPQEFPHMALLGYGDKEIRWLCGGSLISNKFVLTAAHCIISKDLGIVRWIRLGELDINSTTDKAKPQTFTVLSTFVHPEYRSSSHYHDIALIKLEQSVEFNDYIKPACLYPEKKISQELIATGWGKLSFLGESSSHLMKVGLKLVSHENCTKRFGVLEKRLKNGIIDDFQICAGESEKDTCPGDSGGPLQFHVTEPTYFYVVGVTSFGKACGIGYSVGVYTRVSHYIGWIEDIVWPFEQY